MWKFKEYLYTPRIDSQFFFCLNGHQKQSERGKIVIGAPQVFVILSGTQDSQLLKAPHQKITISTEIVDFSFSHALYKLCIKKRQY